jgi:hypothetical protein
LLGFSPSSLLPEIAKDGHAGGMARKSFPPSDQDRFAFGLTTVEVERLRRILSRCGGREVSLEEAWGRGAELLSLTHALMEALAAEARNPADIAGSKVDPGDVLTDSRS